MSDQAKMNHEAYIALQHKLEAESMGKIVLMHDGEVIDIYEDNDAAYDDGCRRYGLGNFSLQVIGERPASLGALSLHV